MGYKAALLGGGANLNSLFLKHRLISEIILTIEPKIFGTGLSLFSQELEADLKLLDFKKLNENTLMLKYQVIYQNV
jgi:dihydrofolate reductase